MQQLKYQSPVKVKFYLLRSKSNKETGLICSVSFNKKRIRFCIGGSINPKYWNSKTSGARKTPAFPESQEFNQRLNAIASKVNKLYLQSFNSNEEPPTKTTLEKHIHMEILQENSKLSFFDFYKEFINKCLQRCLLLPD